MATGTTLAVLLPPIGLAAAFEYYRHGNVNVKAAVILAATMFLGSWIGAYFANHMEGPQLRLVFGLFVCGLGAYLVYGACKLSWLALSGFRLESAEALHADIRVAFFSLLARSQPLEIKNYIKQNRHQARYDNALYLPLNVQEHR
jgi:uncharacterized membrane protein YfcA